MPESGPGCGTIAFGVALGLTLFYTAYAGTATIITSAARSALGVKQYAVKGTVVGEQFADSWLGDTYWLAVENEKGRSVVNYTRGISKEEPAYLSARLNEGDSVELIVAKNTDGELMGLDARLLRRPGKE